MDGEQQRNAVRLLRAARPNNMTIDINIDRENKGSGKQLQRVVD